MCCAKGGYKNVQKSKIFVVGNAQKNQTNYDSECNKKYALVQSSKIWVRCSYLNHSAQGHSQKISKIFSLVNVIQNAVDCQKKLHIYRIVKTDIEYTKN